MRKKDMHVFGTPYDPKHSGKKQATKPGEQADDEIRPSVFGKGPSYSKALSDLVRDDNSPFGFTYHKMMQRAFAGIDIDSTVLQIPEPERETDHALSQAREAVAKWIVDAPEQAFDDIIGHGDALARLKDAIQAPALHADLYKAYGMRPPKGALLSGPPGCGKTMFARAAAAEIRRLYGSKAEFISASGTELQSGWVGQTEERIKAIFTYAREYARAHGHPLLVFLDEADALLPDRTSRTRAVHSWEESRVATFLAEMDGVQDSGAFVLLASNRPEAIDQAVLRDGRCDFKITLSRPDIDALSVIITRNFNDIPIATETDLPALVMTIVEALQDPAYVLMDAHGIAVNLKRQSVDTAGKSFLLEHIVSGAMAAGLPQRAAHRAFTRDKAGGIARGVTIEDAIGAVRDVFEENKGLDHAFARQEFEREFVAELHERFDDPKGSKA